MALGPEPWGLPDASLPPTPQHGAKAGYREWLQARGQMAMQRSLGSTARPQHSSTAPGQSSHVPVPLPLATAVPGPAPSVNWGSMQGDMQLQWFSPAAASQDLTPVGAGAAQQPALGFGVCSQPTLMLPGCPQTPVANGCLQQSLTGPQSAQVYGPPTPVATPMGCSQASPMAFAGCHPSTPVSSHPSTAHYSFFPQGPETPVAGQQELLAPIVPQQDLLPPQEDCEQEQLMAAVMPEGFSGLDKETIAQRLRAAAPCSYDD